MKKGPLRGGVLPLRGDEELLPLLERADSVRGSTPASGVVRAIEPDRASR